MRTTAQFTMYSLRTTITLPLMARMQGKQLMLLAKQRFFPAHPEMRRLRLAQVPRIGRAGVAGLQRYVA